MGCLYNEGIVALADHNRRKRGFSCIPSETYKDDCNTCVCNDDGTNAACTEIQCFHNKAPIVEQPSQGQVISCIPHETYLDDCNTCVCNSEGNNAACTEKFCVHTEKVVALSEHKRKRQAVEISCIPNETYLDDCNTCVCNAEGNNAACTLMHCIHYEDDVYAPLDKTYFGDREFKDLKIVSMGYCTPFDSFALECNNCNCNNKGTNAACTQNHCASDDEEAEAKAEEEAAEKAKQEKAFSCIPNESYLDDCNTCVCNEDGTNAACTLMECFSNHLRKRSAYPESSEAFRQNKLPINSPGFKCKPRSHFKDDCNMCICNPNGNSAACTLALCPPPKFVPKASPRLRRSPKVATNSPGYKCNPNSTFKDDCNTCICDGSGTFAACTLMYCIPNDTHHAVQKRDTVAEPEKCEPGSRFKKDCNTCWCTETGVVACTLRGCLPKLGEKRTNV